ncbi:monocarboxylate transporter 10-like [Planococcus citri]|uniref:monocarboxylate transporter 10-like n=1 Tax=Planococcus citri TaxID=170843 RepID=UPI0031F95056
MPEEKQPPDGGTRAYIVLFASFLCNGLIFGIVNSYSIIYNEIYKNYTENKMDNAAAKASLIGSLMIGTTFLLSMVSGMVSDRIGIRPTTCIGGFIITCSLLISSFYIENVYVLIFSCGIMYGIGASLTYIPSLTIIGHYFKKNIGLANGFVTLGSSVFTIIMPFLLDYLLKTVGLNTCFRYLAALLSCLMLCSFAFKPRFQSPLTKKSIQDDTSEAYFANFLNISIWKNPRYVLWIVAVPIALCGYFVPYVHMAMFIRKNFKGENEKLPVVCIAITSAIGRILFGKLSDLKGVNSIILQQLSFVVIGIVSILTPFIKNYTLLLMAILIMGLFDGCFITVVGPIAFKFCGPKGAGQAIGFLLGLISIPITIGPTVAGAIYDQTKSYTLPFILAGIPPFIGAAMMTKIHFMESAEDEIECVESKESSEKKQLTSDAINTKETGKIADV